MLERRSYYLGKLSNDVWEGGKSIIQALYQNSGNPSSRPAYHQNRDQNQTGVKPELNLTLLILPTARRFPDEWSENKVDISRAQDLAAGALESFQALERLSLPQQERWEVNVCYSRSPAVAVYNGKLLPRPWGSGRRWFVAVPLTVRTGLRIHSCLWEYPSPRTGSIQCSKLYCVREGAGEDGWLWVCTFDGQESGLRTHNCLLARGSRRHGICPCRSTCTKNGSTVSIVEGKQKIVRCGLYFDGCELVWDTQLPNHSTSSGPALAVGASSSLHARSVRRIRYVGWKTCFDGNTWSEDKELLVVMDMVHPALPPHTMVDFTVSMRDWEKMAGYGPFNQTDKTDKTAD